MITRTMTEESFISTYMGESCFDPKDIFFIWFVDGLKKKQDR